MATSASKTPALEIRDLQAWSGESHVLHGYLLVVNGNRGRICEAARGGRTPPHTPSS